MDKREINDRYAEIGMNLVKTDSACNISKTVRPLSYICPVTTKRAMMGKRYSLSVKKFLRNTNGLYHVILLLQYLNQILKDFPMNR